MMNPEPFIEPIGLSIGNRNIWDVQLTIDIRDCTFIRTEACSDRVITKKMLRDR